MNNITFRQSKASDISAIMKIICEAQTQLKQQGIDQWQNGYPNEQAILADISTNTSYVLLVDEKIIGTACISFDGEPTYDKIYNGSWLSDGKYAVIHRIAVSDAVKGNGYASVLMSIATDICRQNGISSIKIDTHADNTSMQSLLKKNNFTCCGIIYLADGNSRIAYEKLI